MMKHDFLMHHGVKGMKWGVRHDPERVDRVRQILQKSHTGHGFGHYGRNNRNNDLPETAEDALKRGWKKLSDVDSALHQHRTKDGVRNTKWLSPDGHKEVVFTGKEQKRLITSEDEGTFNIFDPTKHPIGHATIDVLPYILYGNNPTDTTTIRRRVYESYEGLKNRRVAMADDKSITIGEEYCKKHKIA